MTGERKITELAELSQRLERVEKEASEAYAEVRRLIEKRDKLNEKVRTLRQDAHGLKEERDSINAKVHDLKLQRDETKTTIRTIIEEKKVVREKIAELRKKTPKRSQSSIQEEIDDIEWKIQTTSLDLQEEKKLIETVKQLEMQSSAYRKIEQQKKKIDNLQHGLETLDETGENLHTQLSDLAQRSQETHQNMLSKIDEVKKVKEEADAIHQAYLQSKERAKPLDQERRRLSEQVRLLRETARREDETARKATEKSLKEELESKAREKLERGEKLSWEEFQLLSEEDGSETQD